MQKFIKNLPLASGVLAVCAAGCGLAAGFLAIIGATEPCVDGCPTREVYFSRLGLSTVGLMIPCIVFEVLAVAAFLANCLATRQARRAVMPLLFLLVGGLVGVATLDGLFLLLHSQATLPVDSSGHLVETPAKAWAVLWGISLLLIAGAWSSILAYLQWLAYLQ